MKWVLEHLQILIGIAAAIAYVLNHARAAKAQQDEPPVRDAAEEELAERTRRVQEEIRRKIAERRGEVAPAPTATTLERAGERTAPPLLRPAELRPIDPFGGPKPLRRPMGETMERDVDPAFEERRRAEEATAHRAVLERQERLAEEMRALDAARAAEQRKAAEILTRRREQAAAMATREPRAAVSAGLVDALRDPQELRRAIVLREVLGAPVALR